VAIDSTGGGSALDGLVEPGNGIIDYDLTVATGTGTAGAGLVPLTPTIRSSTLPDDAVIGAGGRGVVTVSVEDTGTAPVSGTANVDVYASATGLVTDGTSIGHAFREVKLRAGQSVSMPVQVDATLLPIGTYELVARVTNDIRRSVADSVPAFREVIGIPAVSLSLDATPKLPGTIRAGHAFTLTLVITEDGNSASIGPASLVVNVNNNGTHVAAASATLQRNTLPRAQGKTATLSLRLIVRSDTAADDYEINAIIYSRGSVGLDRRATDRRRHTAGEEEEDRLIESAAGNVATVVVTTARPDGSCFP
jgi:hypothetical protein